MKENQCSKSQIKYITMHLFMALTFICYKIIWYGNVLFDIIEYTMPENRF